ncbi:MAG: thymidylate kinase [Candidatus Omnitrophota bacterium]|jgi:dTMP kinase|nr:MAG: thymidylate kinase [Candidatus Omnitrophota bacterium]
MNDPKPKTKSFYGAGLPDIDCEELTGNLIVIEGADGSGRSTQITLLKDFLEEKGYAVVNVGLRRSTLVSRELDEAKKGNILGKRTFSLFYATDFADQLENQIIPALRAGFIVLADRYIYTLMARTFARNLEPEWVESLYGIALVPDAVYYLRVSPQNLVERNFRKHAILDYWESGMDIGLSQDVFESFLKYQRLIQAEFRKMQVKYGFDVIDGNRSVKAVAKDLQKRVFSKLSHE